MAQATLADGRWFGRADVLRRVPQPSRFGDWSYEVYDCKLANETKAGTILQLSLYSELLSIAQGILPEPMYVVPPGTEFRPRRIGCSIMRLTTAMSGRAWRWRRIMARRSSPIPSQRSTACPAGGSAALSDGARVVGGTACLWASEKFSEAVDVLFVDEAG